MRVVKRDGRLQEFNLEKIMLTLEKASDESGDCFTHLDIKILAKDIENKIKTQCGDPVHVALILKIVVEQLRESGFNRTAKYYEDYSRERYGI